MYTYIVNRQGTDNRRCSTYECIKWLKGTCQSVVTRWHILLEIIIYYMYILYIRGTNSIKFIWGLSQMFFGDGSESNLYKKNPIT